jgi:hypothetical protein
VLFGFGRDGGGVSAIDPTCLPWQIKHDQDTDGLTTIIGNVDGEIVEGATHYSYDFVAVTLDPYDDSQSRSVGVANAAFIVRACNSHADLLEALERAVARLDQIEGDQAQESDGFTEQCRNLIAKARGAA